MDSIIYFIKSMLIQRRELNVYLFLLSLATYVFILPQYLYFKNRELCRKVMLKGSYGPIWDLGPFTCFTSLIKGKKYPLDNIDAHIKYLFTKEPEEDAVSYTLKVIMFISFFLFWIFSAGYYI
ncbi:MAG: hypothetical protein ABH950_09250 [Candidatus Altiarchaeota archaeon]